jgi:hypothetical protein
MHLFDFQHRAEARRLLPLAIFGEMRHEIIALALSANTCGFRGAKHVIATLLPPIEDDDMGMVESALVDSQRNAPLPDSGNTGSLPDSGDATQPIPTLETESSDAPPGGDGSQSAVVPRKRKRSSIPTDKPLVLTLSDREWWIYRPVRFIQTIRFGLYSFLALPFVCQFISISLHTASDACESCIVAAKLVLTACLTLVPIMRNCMTKSADPADLLSLFVNVVQVCIAIVNRCPTCSPPADTMLVSLAQHGAQHRTRRDVHFRRRTSASRLPRCAASTRRRWRTRNCASRRS